MHDTKLMLVSQRDRLSQYACELLNYKALFGIYADMRQTVSHVKQKVFRMSNDADFHRAQVDGKFLNIKKAKKKDIYELFTVGYLLNTYTLPTFYLFVKDSFNTLQTQT